MIQRNILEIQRCYGALLTRRPAAEGRVTIVWFIDAEGRVPGAKVTSDALEDGTNARCVTAAVRSWAFARPDHGDPVAVRFPFYLSLSPG